MFRFYFATPDEKILNVSCFSVASGPSSSMGQEERKEREMGGSKGGWGKEEGREVGKKGVMK